MPAVPRIKRYSRGDRLYVQAQQIWLILVAHVMKSKRKGNAVSTITYGELALAMGYNDARAGHTLGRQLGIVGDYCKLNNLPTLNSIVVIDDGTDRPGADVVLRKGRTFRQEQKAVMREDWFKLRVPTTGTFRKVWEPSAVA
jgi:hypothetical protein